MAKSQHLDNIPDVSTNLFKAKKVDYNSLPSKRTNTSNTMEKEIKDLKEDIVDTNRNGFSLFKQLLHKTIQKD